MKTNMLKKPENIRKGFKIAGLLAVIVTALCVSVGLGVDTDIIYGATGVVGATGGVEAAISNQEVNTENVKEVSVNILEDSVSDTVTECYKDKATLYYLMNMAKKKMDTINGTFSRVHRFYQIGQRPVNSTVTAAYTYSSSNPLLAVDITVDNASIWTKDSVIYPHTANNQPLTQGYGYESGQEIAEGFLQLIVIGVNKAANKITVQGTNARRLTASDPTTAYLPSIPKDTIFTRMASLGSETDAQASVYTNLPKDTMNYVATFHTQYEVTPDFLKHGKEINFGKAQIQDHTMNDFIDGIEKTLLIGQRAVFTDAIDDDKKYQMGGFLYFNKNEFEYAIDSATKDGLTEKDLNDLMAHTFAGNNGSKTRIMLMGSDFARRAQRLNDTQKWSTRMTPKQKWGFEFTGISNLFGTLDSLLYTQLDEIGMESCAIIIDLENISLIEAEGLAVTALDLKKSGQKNVDASYVTRKLTMEVRNPNTHVLVKPVFI